MKIKSALLIVLLCTTTQIIGMSRKVFLAGAALASAATAVTLGFENYKNWIIGKALEIEENKTHQKKVAEELERQKAIKEKIVLMEPISKSNE